MSYVALYRKYRSQSFSELIGQDQVTRSLQNAIRSARIAHAYLFHGARGCGKTSTARLLARAVNCEQLGAPNPEPCGICRMCVAIRDGGCMDVVEMDAASETGIDDVREKIIENVQYLPGEARYKVYIIDEVHDLSARAFDALLKTLEEPPAHVIFVLATTEYHKVPITIRSRCQDFHFRRGTVTDLANSIRAVVEQEGRTADSDAIQTIARCAEGSWRDALSLLEQVMAFAGDHITTVDVDRSVGTVSAETLARVVDVIMEGDWGGVLGISGELVRSGADTRQILAGLSRHLRDLLLLAAGATGAAAAELGPERIALLETQASRLAPSALLAMQGVLSTAEREIRFTNQQGWVLESTLLRLMPENLPAPGGGRSATLPAPRGPQPAAASVRPPAPQQIAPKPAAVRPAETARPAMEVAVPPAQPPLAAAPRTPTPVTVQPIGAVEPIEAPESVNGAEPVGSSPQFAADVSLDAIVRAWPRILKLFAAKSPLGAPFLLNAMPIALQGTVITLEFQESYSCERIDKKERGRAAVERAINEGLKTEGYKVRCVVADKAAEKAQPPSAAANGPDLLQNEPDSAPDGTSESEGLVKEVIELFGGEVIRSEPLNGGPTD